MTTAETATRSEIEDFLYAEAELLDQWRLPEWFELFTPDARYLVPSADLPAEASPGESLFYVFDDHFRLGARVSRLLKKTAFAENPRAKVRHLIGNVRLAAAGEHDRVATCSFCVWHSRGGVTDTFMGQFRYVLTTVSGAFRIREKRCQLDIEALNPQGRVSFIL